MHPSWNKGSKKVSTEHSILPDLKTCLRCRAIFSQQGILYCFPLTALERGVTMRVKIKTKSRHPHTPRFPSTTTTTFQIERSTTVVGVRERSSTLHSTNRKKNGTSIRPPPRVTRATKRKEEISAFPKSSHLTLALHGVVVL